MGINTSGFVEPSLASGLSTPAVVNEDAMSRPEPTNEEIQEFRTNFEKFRQEKREEQQRATDINASILGDIEIYRENVRRQNFISEMAKNDLSDVHGQALPEGVPVHSMATDEQDGEEETTALEQNK